MVLDADDIELSRMAGGELSKSAASRYGLFHLANKFVGTRDFFKNFDNIQRGSFDIAATTVKNNVADMESYDRCTLSSTSIEIVSQSPETRSPSSRMAKCLTENKDHLTRGDIIRLYFALAAPGGISLWWEPLPGNASKGKLACSDTTLGTATKEMLAQVRQILDRYRKRWLNLPGIFGDEHVQGSFQSS